MNPEQLINLALDEARKAFAVGEVPIGALIVLQDQVVSKAYNLVETTKNPTAHAEILALQDASSNLGRWRLDDCTLVVTLEPCPMCMSAIRLARIKTVIYGATDSRFGFTQHAPTLSEQTTLGPVPQIVAGIQKDQCKALLQEFFKLRR